MKTNNLSVKRILMVTLFIALFSNVINARYLSPDEALDRLTSSKVASAKPSNKITAANRPTLVKTIAASELSTPSVYLFSRENNDVLIVSGVDSAPALLGYVDNNTYSIDSLPPNFEWWLREYASQIEYAEVHPGTMKAESLSSDKEAIDYLVKTKWGQDSPYNNLCPVQSDGYNAVTGCVATALAQVMNYHKWPKQGQGSNSYTDSYKNTYSIDFSEITFDWDSMLDKYDDESSDKSREAVATLMKACGYSVNMNYSSVTSGAVTSYIADAAPMYFDYSSDTYEAERIHYTTAQWSDLLYDQLSKGLPIIYSGRDGIWSNSNGHCFICDGYDGNGYYHFNWGWNGYLDGYFLLSALTPDGSGIGGSDDGYNIQQACFINFYPSNSTIEKNKGRINGRNLCIDNTNNHISTNIYPEGSPNEDVTFGLEFTADDSDTPIFWEIGTSSIAYYSLTLYAYLTINNITAIGLEDGSYEVRFVYYKDDKWNRLEYGPNQASFVTLTVDNSELSFALEEVVSPVTISDVKFNERTEIIQSQSNILSYTATNTSDEPIYWASFHYLVKEGESSLSESIYNVNLVLDAGESRKIELDIPSSNFTYFDYGNYYVVIKAGIDQNSLYTYADESKIFNLSYDAEIISDGIFKYVANNDLSMSVIGLEDAARDMTDLTIPQSINSNGIEYPVTNIAAEALSGCSNIVSIVLPESIKTIGNKAFYECSNLTSVNVPSSVTSIGNYAFAYCTSLTDAVVPNSVISLGEYAYIGCTALKSLTLEDGESTLAIGSSSTNDIWLGDMVETLYIGRNISFNGDEYGPFDSNSNLKKVTFGDNVTNIYANCMYNNIGLTDVIFGSNVSKIGTSAFEGCSNLLELAIPENITSVANNAFASCSGIKKLTIEDSETAISINSSAFDNTAISDYYIGRDLNYWSFSNNTNIVSLTIGKPVTSIPAYAFYGCTGLASLTITDAAVSIGYAAFYNCSNLVSADLGSSVSEIGEWAFGWCTSLSEITIPDDVKTIPQYAFYSCNSLASVTIGNSVNEIGLSAFAYCSNFSQLVIPASVTTIDTQAFYYCPSITSLSFEDSDTELSIGENAFSYVRPQKVYVGRNLSDWFLNSNSNLTEIIFGANVTSIAESALNECSYITTVYSYNTVPPTTSSTFSSNTYNSGKLIVPDESIEDYKVADGWKDFSTIDPLSKYTGVTDIVNTNKNVSEPEYYTLQGVRVVGELTPGLYIKRVGSKASKVIVK